MASHDGRAASGAASGERDTKRAKKHVTAQNDADDADDEDDCALSKTGYPWWKTPHGRVDTEQGSLQQRIREQFSQTLTEALWEAWWRAIWAYKLEMHKTNKDGPSESDLKEWNEFWKNEKENSIADAKKRFATIQCENPTKEQLEVDAAQHYVKFPNFPNCP